MSDVVHPDYRLEANRHALLYWSARQTLADGSQRAIAFVLADDVLWKCAAGEGGASLVSVSKAANGNGSIVMVDVLGDTSAPDPADWIPASGRVILTPADTALLGSTKQVVRYDELLLKDSGDANRLKTIARGRVIVRPSQT